MASARKKRGATAIEGAPLTRGVLAKRAGVNFETVRYYERAGLIPAPARSAAGYRLYGEEMVRRIRFIKRAQALGFTLAEIRELLSLRAAAGARCAEMLARAEAKIAGIEEKIRALEAMREALLKLRSECRGELPISACPILESLEAERAGEEDGGKGA